MRRTTTKSKVYHALLENRGWLSGEELAELLLVSRTAIWKATKSLAEEGVPIVGVPSVGYRINDEPTPFIHEQRIRKYLSYSAERYYKIRIEQSISSTNTALKALAADGAMSGVVMIARTQTNGRGRLGRTFVSPLGTGLYMSVLFRRPKMAVGKSLNITTAAAVAVAESIEACFPHIEAKIKWVNDIYVEDKKVCGILTEGVTDLESGELSYAVIGIGVNLVVPEEGFPEEIADIAGALYDPYFAPIKDKKNIYQPDGNWLAAEILNRLYIYLQAPGAPRLMKQYRTRSLLTGRNVLVRHTVFEDGVPHEQERAALALGIDENGGLRVQYHDNGSVETLISGEAALDTVHLT